MQVVERAPAGPVVLDIGGDVGALIVYTGEALCGREIEVSPKANAARRTHTDVLERRLNGAPAFAAVFAALPEGDYSLWRDVMTDVDVRIDGGFVAEVDWRTIDDPSDFAIAQPHRGMDGATGNGGRARASAAMLPPRYREGRAVSAAPMGSAPVRYTDDGQVAWDQMWTDFCDLAMAGGPAHRPTLLEPATPEEVRADQAAYRKVVSEIERGFRLVTELPIVGSTEPGWVGLQCEDEEMARWLLRAIAVENVSVRRADTVLFLPAAPGYRLDKEIKNVVSVVAKTHHYWREHRRE